MSKKPEHLLADAARDLSRAEPHLSRVLASLVEWAGIGYGKGGSNGRSSGINRPTEQTAVTIADAEKTIPGYVRDSFARDYAQITEDAVILALAAKRIAETVDRTRALPRDPKTGNVVVAPAEGCGPCGLVKDPETGRDHGNGYQRIYTRRILLGETKQPVCSWHDEWWNRYGIAPAPAIELWHLDHPGSRIPHTMVRDHHPLEFERVHGVKSRPLAVEKLGLVVPDN